MTSRKVPLPVLQKQAILPDASDENVGKSVVVVIADGDAHAVKFDVEAGGAGNVGESAVAIVFVELQSGAHARWWPGQSMEFTSRMSCQPSAS